MRWSGRSRARCPVAECRFCATPLRQTFADLATSPLANSFLSEEQLREGETFLPCTHTSARTASSSSSRSSRRRSTSSRTTSTSRPSRELGRARAHLRRGGDPALRPRPGELGRRDRQQRRLPAPVVRRGRRARARDRAGRQRGRGRRGANGIPSLVEFFGTDTGNTSRRRGSPGRPDHRQQRPRARARPERLRRGHARPARAGRRRSRWSSRTSSG